MNDKNKVDRLFQERFKDFEAIPDDKIWRNIYDNLHENQHKKVIPIWWKLSGIAVGMVLAFFAFYLFLNSPIIENKVTLAPKKTNSQPENRLNSDSTTENKFVLENRDTSGNKVVIKTIEKTIDLKTSVASVNNNAAAANDSQLNLSKISTAEKTEVEKTYLSEMKLQRSKNKLFTGKSIVKNKLKSIEKNPNLNKSVVSYSSSEKVNDNFQTDIKENFSSGSEFQTSSKYITIKDLTSVALETETNPLEEIVKKKIEAADELHVVAKINRWQVTTNVAPVYFNSASTGSPIESQFTENSKSYENNLSVGVGIQYAVTKKLTLRTGLNKFTLGYGTNDVVFFGGLDGSGVSNLSPSKATSNIEVMSATNVVGLKPFEDNFQNMERGVLNQRMGYYEVPLELSYAVINRKFGIQVIGGVSTLFLSDNSVSVQSATTTMSLGKANNLNDIHFSTNIGLGFKYGFWKNFEAHFEPTFKYQFSTFSRDSGNFKPYFVGLYSGISFKF